MTPDEQVEAGNACYRSGDAAGAARHYEAAIAQDPAHVRAHFNLGILLQGAQRLEEALAHYEQAIAANAAFAPALVNCAGALAALGRHERALDLYGRALAVNPRDEHARNNLLSLANALEADGQTDLALKSCDLLCAAAPDQPTGHYCAGVILQKAGDFEAALRRFERVLAIRPGEAGAHYQAGRALHNLGRAGEALAQYRAALARQPEFAEALLNAGNVLLEMGDAPAASEMFRRARASPDPMMRARSELALGQLALRAHDFGKGWEGYESRLLLDEDAKRWSEHSIPRLRAEDLGRGRCVGVWSEQGVGDQLVFSTLLPDLALAEQAAIVEVDPRLRPAFERSLPALEFLDPDDFRRRFAECDFQLPLGSLGTLFRPSPESFRRQPRALLQPDPSRAQRYRAQVAGMRTVGISWRSLQPTVRKHLEHRKSATLECFGAFEGAGVRLLDLQYGDVLEERRAFDRRHPGLRQEIPGLDAFDDLDGVLAALAACDRVITISNATAHLAGAAGVPTWLVYLGANPPFHYWVPGNDGRSLWYPSVEVMTDRTWVTWEMAFGAVADRLRREAR